MKEKIKTLENSLQKIETLMEKLVENRNKINKMIRMVENTLKLSMKIFQGYKKITDLEKKNLL